MLTMAQGLRDMEDMKNRDLFAAAALTGLLVKWTQPSDIEQLSVGIRGAAILAFAFADEMIKERELATGKTQESA